MLMDFQYQLISLIFNFNNFSGMSGSTPKSGLKIRRKSAKSQSLGALRKFRLQPPDLVLPSLVLECCYVDEKLVSSSSFGPKRKKLVA